MFREEEIRIDTGLASHGGDFMRIEHLPRFKAVTWRSGRNNVFHLLMNVLVETIRALPRTLAYSAVILAVLTAVL